MKPYGVIHIGPVCAWGCCFMQTSTSGPSRKKGHGGVGTKIHKRRARAIGKIACKRWFDSGCDGAVT